MNLLLLATLLGPAGHGADLPVTIGTHYTDDLDGLAVYRSAKESVLLSLNWASPDGPLKHGYKALMDAKVHFREAAPDDSYHRISWTVGSSTVTYEWGLVGKNGAVGRISSTGNVVISPKLGPAWPGSKPTTVAGRTPFVQTVGGLTVTFKPAAKLIGSVRGLGAAEFAYAMQAQTPLQFAIGVGNLADPNKAGAILDAAKKRYDAKRLWAEGDWGDFLSPIEDQLGNSKVYSIGTGRLAHIVSRNWCLPDGQVLFCWDSFFNGLLSSLEDPVAARRTVLSILQAATPEGFVPNYAGRGWGTSSDRSQPPVGSYCIWKMNQRKPDLAFLKEAYPKLLKWHRWWFAKPGPNKGPNRDGNGDGLLEWGTGTGDLQNAKFESGLDDSPMFDDGHMAGAHMDLDSTDLNALWAMDAEYLARIADAVGQKEEAAILRKEKARMAQRMNALLWNDAAGVYDYRYWQPKKAIEELKSTSVFTAEGQPGFKAEYFQGRELKGDAVVRQDPAIDFEWDKPPLTGFQTTDFSVRWTADFIAPKTGPYQFEAISDDGCRLWVDGKKIVDGWSIHPPITYDAPELTFTGGSRHQVRMEYFQAAGGSKAKLTVRRIATEKAAMVFSPRLSPLNFYPLIVNAPSKPQARRTLNIFFRSDRFGGRYVCPTISKNDPAYPAQGYWRGTVWGPTSYLTFQGLRRYATVSEMDSYAQKSVALFMKNWNADGSCHENFNSITGWGRSDPHYTWGELLCLLGLEQLCDTDIDGKVVLNGASGLRIKVHNLPIGGRMFDLTVEPHKAFLTEKGKVVAIARGKVSRIRI